MQWGGQKFRRRGSEHRLKGFVVVSPHDAYGGCATRNGVVLRVFLRL